MRNGIQGFLGLALVLLLTLAAQAGRLPPTFTNQYQPAVEQLRQAYRSVAASGSVRIELPRQQKYSEQTFVFRASGEKRRLDLRTTAQQGMGQRVGTTLMQMATPWGSLNTETGPESTFFDDAQQTSYDNTVAAIDRGCLLTYPYAMGGPSTILEMLQSPAVKIAYVKWIRVEGQPMVEVKYTQSATHAGRAGNWNATLVLSPGEGWALRSFERTLDQGSGGLRQTGQLQYAPGAGDLPAVQSIRIETTQGSEVIRRESVIVSEIKFGPVDEGYFDSFKF